MSAVSSPADRLRDLYRLRVQLDAEIARAEKIQQRRPRARRSKHDPPPACGTEAGYQRHRYLARKGEPWPLPLDDPCGCLRAHRDENAVRQANQRAALRRLRRELASAS